MQIVKISACMPGKLLNHSFRVHPVDWKRWARNNDNTSVQCVYKYETKLKFLPRKLCMRTQLTGTGSREKLFSLKINH